MKSIHPLSHRSASRIAALAIVLALCLQRNPARSAEAPAAAGAGGAPAALQIDADFPGGNIVVDSIAGDVVRVHQDLRDTEGDWFYWYLRARSGQGREITYTFTKSDVIGVRGPAVSLDGGRTWSWLGREAVDGKTFRHRFPQDAAEVRLSFTIPYLERDLQAFLERHRGSPFLEIGTLCRTRKGRSVEKLRVGRLDGRAEHRVLLTCRHHACESLASFCLEGFLDAVISGADDGAWLRSNVEILAVPFMDKDGVEDGDQGKNRKPHDHNRDYAGESIYPSVKGLREIVPSWSDGILRVALDLHCPWIRGDRNEQVYFVGTPSEGDWIQLEELSRHIEVFRMHPAGTVPPPIPFAAPDNLPFGEAWNTGAGPLESFARWASKLPGIWLATSLELPYANARGVEVNADSARAFGRDLTRGLRAYLQNGGPAVQVDRHGRLIVEGSPFFPIGWYSDGDPARLDRLEDAPFNCILDYGSTARPVDEIRSYLNRAEAKGIRVIFCVNDVYPSATHRKSLGEWAGNEAILRGVVSTFRDHPALLAWYNNDELPVEKVPEIEEYYRRIAALDRAHPQLLVHYRPGTWKAFSGAADVIGVDNYPVPRNPPAALGDAVLAARAEVADHKPVWAVVQSFAWYQHRDPAAPFIAGDRGTPRARIPAPAEWEEGRPPSFDELRAMTYLALVGGAKGLLYWCLYNLEYLPDRADRWADALRVAREVEALAPVLVEPGLEPVNASDPGIRAILKRHAGKRYVIAVNATRAPLRASFDLDPQPEAVSVEFEERTLRAHEGKLTDFFAPLGRHVYVAPER